MAISPQKCCQIAKKIHISMLMTCKREVLKINRFPLVVFFREKFFCVPKVVPKKLLGSCIPLVNLWCIVAFPCQLRVHNGFLSQLTLQTIFSTTCAAIKSTPKSHELFRGPRTPCRAQGISCKCQQVYKSQKK